MYLEGNQIEISTKSLRQHVGRSVVYLLHRDIDKSGRGYFSPKGGTLADVYRKNVTFENGETAHFTEIVEIVLNTKA